MGLVKRSCIALALWFLASASALAQITATIVPASPTAADFVYVRLQGYVCVVFNVNPVTQQGLVFEVSFQPRAPCFSVPLSVNLTVPLGSLAQGSYTVVIRASQLTGQPDIIIPLVIAAATGAEAIPVLSSHGLALLTLILAAAGVLAARSPARRSTKRGRVLHTLIHGLLLAGVLSVKPYAYAAGLEGVVVMFDPRSAGPLAADLVDATNGGRSNPALLAQFGNPDDARFVLRERTRPEVLAYLDPFSPQRLMGHYVLLTFPADRSGRPAWKIGRR